MTFIIYLIIVCYLPILGGLIPVTSFGHGIPDLDAVRILFLMMLLFYFVENAIRWKIKFSYTWIYIALIFACFAMASVFWSGTPYVLRALREVLFMILMPVLLAFIGLNLFRDKSLIKSIIKHIAISAFIVSLISIIRLLIIKVAGGGGFRSAGFGALENPNALATFLVLTFPCILYAIEKEIFPWIIGIIITGTTIIGELSTISRKGAVSMVLCLLLYLLFKKKYRLFLLIGASLSIVALILSGISMYSSRFSETTIEDEFDRRGRLVDIGMEMFKDSPLIGLGWEGYYHNYGRYSDGLRDDRDRFDAHNIYITALTDFGIIGFIPFLLIFVYPLFYSLIVLSSNSLRYGEHTRDMAILCFSAVLPFMINGYFSGGIVYRESRMFLLYSIIAIFISSIKNDHLQAKSIT